MREVVDHFFPPVSMLVKEGGEAFTDFTYWRDSPKGLENFSATDSDDEGSDDDGEIEDSANDLAESCLSKESMDQSTLSESIRTSLDIGASAQASIEETEEDFTGDYLDEAPPTEMFKKLQKPVLSSLADQKARLRCR